MTIALVIEERNSMKQDTVNNREILYTQIIEALAKMPEELREVFVLNHYEGMTDGAIATEIGIRPPELETLVWQANSAFQRALGSN